MERVVTWGLLAAGLLSGAGVAAGGGVAAVGPAVLAMVGCIVLRTARN